MLTGHHTTIFRNTIRKKLNSQRSIPLESPEKTNKSPQKNPPTVPSEH